MQTDCGHDVLFGAFKDLLSCTKERLKLMLKNVHFRIFNFVIILYLSGDNCSAEARKQEQNTVGLV